MSTNLAHKILEHPLQLVPTKTRKTKEADNVRFLLQDRLNNWNVDSPSPETTQTQIRIWNYFLEYYFRVEMAGWEKLPDSPSLLIGIHSGTWLTMDAWVLCALWLRKFETRRTLHGTAHDMLFGMPGLGNYFRKVGVIPASRASVTAAFEKGHDVVIWPGGEIDAMRAWSKRDQVVLGNRKGFVRQAIRSGVPITPVATTGGHDTVFVLSEGRALAKRLHLKKWLRSEMSPIILGAPFGITIEAFPMHIPLPSKIRIELLDPIEVSKDTDKENDQVYVDQLYKKVERSIQAGVNRLAAKRKFPVFG